MLEFFVFSLAVVYIRRRFFPTEYHRPDSTTDSSPPSSHTPEAVARLRSSEMALYHPAFGPKRRRFRLLDLPIEILIMIMEQLRDSVRTPFPIPGAHTQYHYGSIISLMCTCKLFAMIVKTNRILMPMNVLHWESATFLRDVTINGHYIPFTGPSFNEIMKRTSMMKFRYTRSLSGVKRAWCHGCDRECRMSDAELAKPRFERRCWKWNDELILCEHKSLHPGEIIRMMHSLHYSTYPDSAPLIRFWACDKGNHGPTTFVTKSMRMSSLHRPFEFKFVQIFFHDKARKNPFKHTHPTAEDCRRPPGHVGRVILPSELFPGFNSPSWLSHKDKSFSARTIEMELTKHLEHFPEICHRCALGRAAKYDPNIVIRDATGLHKGDALAFDQEDSCVVKHVNRIEPKCFMIFDRADRRGQDQDLGIEPEDFRRLHIVAQDRYNRRVNELQDCGWP